MIAEKNISENASPTYFQNLDVIRFFSAFMIIIFHAFYGWKDNRGFPKFLTDDSGQLSAFGKLIENGMHNLVLNVEVFFMISGFVITHLLLAEKEKSEKVNLGRYYIRRALRILPLYYIVLGLTPLYNYYYNEATPHYLNFIFMGGNFELIQRGWGAATVNPLWTLCIEAQFYLIWPLLVAFIPRKWLMHVFSFIILMSVAFRISVFHSENWWMTIYMHTLSRIDVIAVGAIIALIYHNNKNISLTIPRWIRLMVYSVFLFVYFTDDAGYIDSLFLVSVKKYFYVLVIAFALMNYLFNPTAMFAPKRQTIFHSLGKITYGTYIFNVLVVALVIKTYNANGFQNIFLFYLTIGVCSISVATLSYFLIERPFMNLKNNFFILKFFESKKGEE